MAPDKNNSLPASALIPLTIRFLWFHLTCYMMCTPALASQPHERCLKGTLPTATEPHRDTHSSMSFRFRPNGWWPLGQSTASWAVVSHPLSSRQRLYPEADPRELLSPSTCGQKTNLITDTEQNYIGMSNWVYHGRGQLKLTRLKIRQAASSRETFSSVS